MKATLHEFCALMKRATTEDKPLIGAKLMVLAALVHDQTQPIPPDIFDGLDERDYRLILQAFTALMSMNL